MCHKRSGCLWAEGDLALGRLRFLTDSVSRCICSSCGRKDAHPVFPCLELFFLAFASPVVFCAVGRRVTLSDEMRVEEAGGMAGPGKPGREVHCWSQGKERGDGGTAGKWLLVRQG